MVTTIYLLGNYKSTQSALSEERASNQASQQVAQSQTETISRMRFEVEVYAC